MNTKSPSNKDALPSLSERLLSVAYYSGLAPLALSCRRPSANSFLAHHYAQAMGAFFLLLLLFLGACVYDAGECLLFVQFPGLAQRIVNEWAPVLAYLNYVSWLVIAIVGGCRGSPWPAWRWQVPCGNCFC